MAFQFRNQPFQSFQIVEQTRFCVLVCVVENPDGPMPSAGHNGFEQLRIEAPLPDGNDFFRALFHAVQIKGEEIRFHFLQQLRKSGKVFMAVMQIVNDAHVGKIELLDNRNLILGFAEPTAVVIESNLATDFCSLFRDRTNPVRLGQDARLLFFRSFRGSAAAHDPELGLEIVSFQDIEDLPGLGIEGGGEPPCRQLNLMFLERIHLGIKRGDMLGAIVIGEAVDPQSLQHKGPLLRPALFRIERHNAPRYKIGAGEELILLPCSQTSEWQNQYQ